MELSKTRLLTVDDIKDGLVYYYEAHTPTDWMQVDGDPWIECTWPSNPFIGNMSRVPVRVLNNIIRSGSLRVSNVNDNYVINNMNILIDPSFYNYASKHDVFEDQSGNKIFLNSMVEFRLLSNPIEDYGYLTYCPTIFEGGERGYKSPLDGKDIKFKYNKRCISDAGTDFKTFEVPIKLSKQSRYPCITYSLEEDKYDAGEVIAMDNGVNLGTSYSTGVRLFTNNPELRFITLINK